MLEFALVLPFLIIMFMGVVELGFIINDYLVQIQANADAAKYGTKCHGRGDAAELIIGKYLDARGHLSEDKINIYGANNQDLGTFKKSSTGDITDSEDNTVILSSDVFFMYDNNTSWTTEDDIPIASTNINATYVTVNSVYNHSIIIPGMNVFTQNSIFPISTSNTFPCNMMSIDTSDSSVGPLGGACPVTVIDQPFTVGTQYTLKGKSDEDPDRPGNFGWINLDPAEDGNKNENIATWITGPSTPQITIPEWIGGFTGQRNADVIKTALNGISGKYVAIFIHDSHDGTGSNLRYHETGMAIFKIENFIEQPGTGQAYLEITGTFIKRLY